MKPDSIHQDLPPQPMGYHWRPARRDDGVAINQLLLEIEAVDRRDWIDTLDDRERDFKDSSTNIETDTILAITPDNQIAALGWIFAPLEADLEYVVFLWGEVHPNHRRRGLGNFILSWLERRGREILATRPTGLPQTLRIGCHEKLVDRMALYQAHGFEPVRSYYRMRRDLSQPILDPAAPGKIKIERWQTHLDLEALQVFNDAFRDHWGFVPTSEEFWHLFLAGHPDFRADLSFMAFTLEASEGKQLVGLSLNQVHTAEILATNIQEGWIQELAVLRDWRRQGIATALLRASMLAFRADGLEYAGLGVDTANPTGALQIYERDGFVPIQRSITFSKTV
jgi:mycothiol synthase